MSTTMRTKQSAVNNDIIRQGSILAIASIVVRIISLFYRIPMANIIGDEGNGIYSAAFEVYNIVLILSSFSIPTAVSKLISERFARRQYKNAYRVFTSALLFSFVTGGSAALIIYFGADFLEHTFFVKYEGMAIPLRVLAPTIFIVAILGVLRGLLQGKNTMMPTAVSQVIEQIVNAIVSVWAAYSFMKMHSASPMISAWGAAGGTMGTCLGALSGLLFMAFIYVLYQPILKRKIRRDPGRRIESYDAIMKGILVTVVPIILSQTVFQVSGIIDLALFSELMGQQNYSGTVVSSLQGVYSTDYRLLINVPIAVSSSFAASIIPNIVASYSNGDLAASHKKIHSAIKFNMIVAIPSAVGLMVLGTPIVHVLFPSTDFQMGGKLLFLGSVSVILYAHSTVTGSALQSVDRMKLPVINSLIALVIHIIVVILCLAGFHMGVFALVVGNIVFPLIVMVLNWRSLWVTVRFRQEIFTTFIIPFAASACMAVPSVLLYKLLKNFTGIHLALMLAVVLAVAVYFVAVLKMRGLTREEIEEFPMGRRLYLLACKWHLM